MKQFLSIIIVASCLIAPITGAREHNTHYINPDEYELLLINKYGKFTRTGDKLEIKLDNGIKIYENTDNVKYRVEEIYHLDNSQNYALISVESIPPYVEFINLGSGDTLQLTGYPVFSFDNNRFIETTLDLESGEYNNTVRVFFLENKAFKLEWSHEYKRNMGPSNPVWLNNSEFVYFENTYRNSEPTFNNLDRRPVRVIYKNRKWDGPIVLE